MISFINKQLDKNNFKVWLYTPGSAFLGELIVDNPVLTLQLEGLISTFDFTIPENIDVVQNTNLNNIVNPRLNEALDQFQVEVWYGDLATENYQKQRFIIIDTPNSFGNDTTRFSYRAYSREYENKFIRVVNWPGVLVEEYIQKQVYNISNNIDQAITVNLDYKLKDERLIRAELVKDFVYRLVNQTVSETPYQFSIQPKESSLKIFKSTGAGFALLVKDVDYAIVRDSYTNIISIEYITVGNANLSLGDITYIEYKLEEPPTFGLIRNEDFTLSSEFDFYYTAPPTSATNGSVTFFVPNIPKVFSKTSVLSYDNVVPTESQVQVKLYYEPILTAGETLAAEDIFQNVTTNALTIQQVMNNILKYGDEDDNSAKWTAFYSAQLGNELRSGFAFNNATLLSAINETLKAFDAIAMPDTINKRFYIYQKDSPDTFIQNNVVVSAYRQPTGLSIEYGKYLRDVQQTISSESIVTIIRGVGKDNLTANSATPTGYNEWEDYTYYLDGATISNLETIIANPNTGLSPTLSRSSRWMSDDLTIKLLLWQFARGSIEDVLYNTIPIAQQNRLGGYTDKGIVIAQDEIVERIVANESKIIPLRVELSKSNTLLTTLEITENVEHLITWTGTFEGVNYSGIAGYNNYINAKKNKVLSEITQIEATLNQLQSDFDFINGLLAQFYVAIEKDKFTALFNNSDLAAYNFTEANLQELNGFRREGLYENKFITKASTLFVEMKNEINSLKQPRVEVSANVVGILQAGEARAEWNNLVLGGLANLIVDRLNIDRQIQIKTLTISPDANSTNINFSTEKNYIGIGQKYLGRFFSSAAYNLKNNLGYNEGFWNRGSEDGENAADKLAQGFLIGGNNPLTTQTVIISDEGIKTDGHTVNPIDDSVVSASSDIGRMLLFGFVKINAGRIDVFNRNQAGQVVNKVVVAPTGLTQETGLNIVAMNQEGFSISKKVGNDLQKQFFVDTNGTLFFAGRISQEVYEDLNLRAVIVDAPGFFIRMNADGSNPIPTSITLTATLAAGFTTYNWQYFNGTIWVDFGNTTPTLTVAHNNTVWTASVLRVRCVTNNDQSYEVSLYKVLNGVDGQPGQTIVGPPGPGVVFRGRYDPTEFYFHTTLRRDIVTPENADSPPYLANNTSKSGTNNWGTPGGADWTLFGAQFSSVATDILLTTDANIRRALVMGDTAGNVGVIRSAAIDSKTDITNPASPPKIGFFLDGLDGSINANIGRIGGWNMSTSGLFRSATTSFVNPLPPFDTVTLAYSCIINPEELSLQYDNTATGEGSRIRLNYQGVLVTGTGGSMLLGKNGLQEPFEAEAERSRLRFFGGDSSLDSRRDLILRAGRGDTTRLNNVFVRKTDPNNTNGVNREIPGATFALGVNNDPNTITFYIAGRAVVVNAASASGSTPPPTPPPPTPPPPTPPPPTPPPPTPPPPTPPPPTPTPPTPPPYFSPLG